MWHDNFIMREARSCGIKVLSVILSWDNTSTKGMEGAVSDSYVVWTETMKEEITSFFDVSRDKIFVSGSVIFDSYYRNHNPWNYNRLCTKYGLDPKRKLIVVGTKSPSSYPYNPDVVEIIAKAIADDLLCFPCQILVRLHPNHFRPRKESHKIESDMERYRYLQNKYDNIYLDIPEVNSYILPVDMPAKEIDKLTCVIKNADILVTMFSTLMLEASVCDVPIINAAMFAHNENLNVSDCRVKGFYHIARVLETGGVRTAYTPEKLIEYINQYLFSPSTDKEERAQIVANECQPNLGSAGTVLGNYISRQAIEWQKR